MRDRQTTSKDNDRRVSTSHPSQLRENVSLAGSETSQGGAPTLPAPIRIGRRASNKYSVGQLTRTQIELLISCVKWADTKIINKDLDLAFEEIRKNQKVILIKCKDSLVGGGSHENNGNVQSQDREPFPKQDQTGGTPAIIDAQVVYDEAVDLGRRVLEHSNLRVGKASARDVSSEPAGERLSGRLLSKTPSQTWTEHRLKNETPPEFIQRVYGEHIGNGLILSDLRVDPLLYHALAAWRQTKSNVMPFKLPTEREDQADPAGLRNRLKEVEREASSLRRRLKRLSNAQL